jgi:outer membrane autotransporter protein
MGVWFVDAAATVGVSDGDSHRTIAFGTVARVAQGSFNGTSIAGLVSAGARWRRPDGLFVEPSLSLVASRSTQDGYTEIGAGDLDLVVARTRDSAVQARLGARAAKPFVLRNGTRLNLEGQAAWVEELGGGAPTVRSAFSAAPTGSFTLAGANPGSSAIVVGAGMTYALSSRMSLYGRYDEAHNDNGADRQATLGVRLSW